MRAKVEGEAFKDRGESWRWEGEDRGEGWVGRDPREEA
jgi:hypothetical protein